MSSIKMAAAKSTSFFSGKSYLKTILFFTLILIPILITIVLLIWNLKEVRSEVKILRKKLNESESRLFDQDSKIRDYHQRNKRATEWSACICPPCQTSGYSKNRRRKSFSTRTMSINGNPSNNAELNNFLEENGIPSQSVIPLIQMHQSQQQHASINAAGQPDKPYSLHAMMQQHQQQSASIRLSGSGSQRTAPFPAPAPARDEGGNLYIRPRTTTTTTQRPWQNCAQGGRATTCKPLRSMVINLDDYGDSEQEEDANRRGARPLYPAQPITTPTARIHDESYFGPVGPVRTPQQQIPPMEFRQASPEKGEEPAPQYDRSPPRYDPPRGNPPQEFRQAVQSPEKGEDPYEYDRSPPRYDPPRGNPPQEFRQSPEKGEDPYEYRAAPIQAQYPSYPAPLEYRQASPDKGDPGAVDPYGYGASPLEYRQASPEKGEEPAPQYDRSPPRYDPPRGNPPQEFRQAVQSPEKGEDPYEFRAAPVQAQYPSYPGPLEFRQASEDKGDPGYVEDPYYGASPLEFRQVSPEKGEDPPQYGASPRGQQGARGPPGPPGRPGLPGYSPSKGY